MSCTDKSSISLVFPRITQLSVGLGVGIEIQFMTLYFNRSSKSISLVGCIHGVNIRCVVHVTEHS